MSWLPSLLLSTALFIPSSHFNEEIEGAWHSLVDSTFYFGAGTLLGSASVLAGISGSVCQLFPWTETMGRECLLASHICEVAAKQSFVQLLKCSPLASLFVTQTPSPYSSWNGNKKMLSRVPASSLEDKELLSFLQRRWLAKTTGCFPFFAEWMCPSFGISLQVHPETTNSYARDPSNKFSETYKNRVDVWKEQLPHPRSFPLILTRPAHIGAYLPSYFEFPQDEDKILSTLSTTASPLIVDLTGTSQRSFSQWCQAHHVNLDRILCIECVQQKEIGGIRILPFPSSSKEKIEEQHQFLLEWISRFGLSANRIELDRCFCDLDSCESPFLEHESKEEWLNFLNSIDIQSTHPQKNLMLEGTLQLLKGLYASLSQEKWEAITRSPTRCCVAQLTFKKIKQQLQLVMQKDENASFHDTVTQIEQIHADLSSLLEIFSPFEAADFYEAFQQHLTFIPQEFHPLVGYDLHSSGMTSLAGIFKATEKTLGRAPRILYGENTYFECIHAVERIAHASSTTDATEQDWENVDLILAQFNPTVKRINFKVTEYQATEYHVEKIEGIIHRALEGREGRPLSIALDCTLDFSNSPRVGTLLSAFQKEIERGELNVICYRSGLKFDLFGMDNYCGAPFFMIHNHDSKWSFFDSLLRDPVLKTDRLSLNWFCLAYTYAPSYLEEYRKQIFDNTRAVLDNIPPSLFDTANPNYRVIPMDSDVNPSFIDIKIFGPLHALRGGLLVGVFLTVKCMEAGYPLLYRPGIGFYHPNLAVLFGSECTTVRLTLGLDPAQVTIITSCLEKIATLNLSKSSLLLLK